MKISTAVITAESENAFSVGAEVNTYLTRFTGNELEVCNLPIEEQRYRKRRSSGLTKSNVLFISSNVKYLS